MGKQVWGDNRMIKKEGNKYILYSKDGDKKLGTFDTEEQAKEREAEINRIKHAKKGDLVEISLTITKASLQEDGTMRWQAVTSDTTPDRTGERTSLSLFKDWIERAENGKTLTFLPAPRMPFLGLSHYPDLEGLGEAGPTEKMYIDGKLFKASGVFHRDGGHPLGEALFKAVRKEQALIKKGETIENPIRISAAWWDIAHAHGDFVFERKSLTEKCPMCTNGASDKTYLKGQLDHFAATRVPINPRTSLELTERAMTTRKEDAESIIDDPALVEELDEKAKLIGKSEAEEETPEAMVIKADEEEADEEEEIEVEKMEDDRHHRPFGGATSLGEAETAMRAQEQVGEVMSNYGMFKAVMGNILETSEPGDIKNNVQNLLTEFSDRVAAIKAAIEDVTMLEPVVNLTKGESQIMTTQEHPYDVAKARYDEIMADEALSRDDKLKALQESFTSLGEIVKAEVNAVAPQDPGEAVAQAFAPIADKLDLLLTKLGEGQQQPQAQPQQKSYAPSGPVNQESQVPVSPVTGQPSALTAMIRRSVGIQQ